jgi:hypothetical protein
MYKKRGREVSLQLLYAEGVIKRKEILVGEDKQTCERRREHIRIRSYVVIILN